MGTYLCGPLADQVATFFTTRNHGIREPEMRLPTCIVAAVLTFLGALLAGLTYHYRTHWSGPIVGFGLLSAGAQMGATLAISYAVDCHLEVRKFTPAQKLLKYISGCSRITLVIAIRRTHGDSILSQVCGSMDLDLVHQ